MKSRNSECMCKIKRNQLLTENCLRDGLQISSMLRGSICTRGFDECSWMTSQIPLVYRQTLNPVSLFDPTKTFHPYTTDQIKR